MKRYQALIDEKRKKLLKTFKMDKNKIENINNDVHSLKANTIQGKKEFSYIKKVNYLQVDKTRVETQNLIQKSKKFKIEKMVSNACLLEYQNLNYRQSNKIKEMKSDVQYIKYKLSEELYKFASQLELLKRERMEMEKAYKDKIECKQFFPLKFTLYFFLMKSKNF